MLFSPEKSLVDYTQKLFPVLLPTHIHTSANRKMPLDESFLSSSSSSAYIHSFFLLIRGSSNKIKRKKCLLLIFTYQKFMCTLEERFLLVPCDDGLGRWMKRLQWTEKIFFQAYSWDFRVTSLSLKQSCVIYTALDVMTG